MEATSPVPSSLGSPEPVDQEEGTRKSILRRFIEVYKSMPVLWNTSLKEYSDKHVKRKGYETLLEILVHLKPKATIEDVKKQINTLRSNYRKELKKIKDSKRTGTGTDNIYEPSAWTFYELQFLADVEVPDKGRNTIVQNEASQDTQIEDVDIIKTPKRSKPTQKQDKQDQKQLLALACEYLTKEEEYPIAKVWATKLQKIDPLQRTLAEKAINDILFEAELGTLNRNSVKINSADPSSRSTSSATNYTFSSNNSNYGCISSVTSPAAPYCEELHNAQSQQGQLEEENVSGDPFLSGIRGYLTSFQ